MFTLKLWWNENSATIKLYAVVGGLITFGLIPWLIGIGHYTLWFFKSIF